MQQPFNINATSAELHVTSVLDGLFDGRVHNGVMPEHEDKNMPYCVVMRSGDVPENDLDGLHGLHRVTLTVGMVDIQARQGALKQKRLQVMQALDASPYINVEAGDEQFDTEYNAWVFGLTITAWETNTCA